MSPEQFIKAFFDFTGNSPECLVFSRGEYLSRVGVVEQYLYMIQEGAVRAIYISKEEEFTVRFGYKGSVITSLDSFINNEPSNFSLQALRKTKAIRIRKQDYFKFVGSSQEVALAHATLMSGLVTGLLEREIDLLTSSPKERYARILKRSPQVFQEVPLKYIAAYLRMTPETLSRLRNLDSDQGLGLGNE